MITLGINYFQMHEFGKRTGLPVIMNTFVNLRGEAIVLTQPQRFARSSVPVWTRSCSTAL